MKAMILTAGEGRRLRPLTLQCPKAMLKIGERPLLEHLILYLKKNDIVEIAINLHYLPEAIKDYFGSGKEWSVNITYSYEERLLGSAGGVKKMAEFFDGPFLILCGDILTNLKLRRLIDFHFSRSGVGTICLHRVDKPEECGVVELDENKRIRSFVEKPRPGEAKSNLVNAGIYIFEPVLLELIPDTVPCDFGRDLFPLIIKQGFALYGYEMEDYLIDVGTTESYRLACKDFLKVSGG